MADLNKIPKFMLGDDVQAEFNNLNQKANDTTAQLATLEQQKADQSFVDLQFANIVSGAPKATYTTLSALQAAYPTGTSGVFLVLADGHWYYWNGSIWEDGGLYQSTGIGNQAIHAKNLNDELYDEILNGYPLNLKDLSLYTSAFTGAKNRIFISNTPLSDKGKINIVFKSVSSHSFYVVLLEKNVSSNQFTILNSSLINVGIGINTIETNFVSTGLGNQYIGIVGVTDGQTPNGYTGTAQKYNNYFSYETFSFSESTFTATLNTTNTDIGLYFVAIPVNGLNSFFSDTKAKLEYLENNVGANGIEDEAITAPMLSSDIFDDLTTDIPYNPKDLSIYTSAFVGAVNRIFIMNIPLAVKGKVNVVFKSVSNRAFYVVLLEKSANQFSLKDKKLVDVVIGENILETPFISTGSGNQYIGIVGIEDGKTPNGYTGAVSSYSNYYSYTTFSFAETTFTPTLNTSNSDIGIYFIISPINGYKSFVDNTTNRLSVLESGSNLNNKEVDLVIKAGQSNMAGRGTASEAPTVPLGAAYEFRAISDPTKLYHLVEPFGVNENVTGAIEETSKTGSMVSSFVIEYNKITKRPIICVSASKGGTTIGQWQPGSTFLNDLINRYKIAKAWLIDNGYIIKNEFMVWCQGESDGDNSTTTENYTNMTKAMIGEVISQGLDKVYMVRIGNHRDLPTKYDTIIQAQTELCKTYEHAVLVSTKFDRMATDGLMKDEYHYKQAGYNITGADAGKNTAFHITTGKEPTMYDWENDNLYYSKK
ncbi:sialate O-acetylesterase [Niallia alba]|uniref:sialate O-acetylesterase n=1 Tax=Niallia alba TaxID=2729105 RepID=UPI002E239734|nr:sialate O-acetylesterase [Niallia alba]